jgi:uncharacterized protein involved in response to NO
MLLQPDGQVTGKDNSDFPIPLFRLAFRPLFWLGALFGAISITVWALLFTGFIDFSPFGGGYFWHVHEMLFGFTAAIIVGFLLTAVQTWTGVSSLKGIPLILLVGIWLLARLLLAFSSSGIELIVGIVDVLFLVLSAVALAIPIVKARLWRNLFFVPILLTMAVVNAFSYLSLSGALSISFIELSHVMVLLVTLVMCIMGGRVFPMFTANGTGTPRVAAIPWLEKLSIGSVFLSVLITAQFIDTPKLVDAFIYSFAGAVNFARAIRWRIWVTFKVPLVWSLHFSYWSICIGLIMLGLVKVEILSNTSSALHAITVGGIGFMILSMISRVSLGHTGRTIKVGKVVSTAFVFIGMSFITRVFAPFFYDDYAHVIWVSAAFWALAYGIFVFRYAPVLFRSRIDGAKG